MSPFEQNPDEIQNLINKFISIQKTNNIIVEGELIKTIVGEFENDKKYIHKVLVVKTKSNEITNINWGDIKSFK